MCVHKEGGAMKTFVRIAGILIGCALVVMEASGHGGRVVRSESVLWVGSPDGGAFASFDRGRTWTRVLHATAGVAGRIAGVTGTLVVVPNPADERIEVRLRAARADAAEVKVYDLRGRSVVKALMSRSHAGDLYAVVDVTSLAAGTYVVVVNGEGVQSEGIIVHVVR
jgi:hypothetical protein